MHGEQKPQGSVLCTLHDMAQIALREEAPDADDRDWYPLYLRRLNQRLRDREIDSNPETLRELLAGLARDGRGLAGSRASLEFRQIDRDQYRVRLHRDWGALEETARRRQAMTIRVLPEAKGKPYAKGHYAPLETHYSERVFQIHVMNAYARLGLEKIRQAIGLIGAYFTLDKETFVQRYFPDQREVLERATTAESFRRIVDSLGNPRQIEIVAAEEDGNRLVLAGPGSGKTRVIVHRCAFLLRVRRVDPRAILVLCYNRNAALELRRRLNALVGDDARGVTIQTYHGFAMRLTGSSFAARGEQSPEAQTDFSRVIEDALALLEGRAELPGIEPDSLRERLLAGYRHILVDEYQDIDAAQYRMIAAIAGRSGAADGDASREPDRHRLSLLAVGDDDQNIYGFRGADVAFIRRFREDYAAQVHYLVENYRSSGHIIAAANALIGHNRERMKTDQTIRIDQRRIADPPGGRWESLDAHGRGRVEVLELADPARQAAALVDRIQRLRALGGADWSDFAVLAFRHETLHPIRALCEAAGIPIAWRQELPPLHRVREIATFLDQLKTHASEQMTAESLLAWLPTSENPWRTLLCGLIDDWRQEAGELPVPCWQIADFCYETLAEQRRERGLGIGVLLATLHGAKGLEFPHVLIADGDWSGDLGEPERRLFYVGMTRARETLTLGRLAGGGNPDPALFAGNWLLRSRCAIDAPKREIAERRYQLLTLADVDLGFAGRRSSEDPVHASLRALRHGDRLWLDATPTHLLLRDRDGNGIGRLSSKASACWRSRMDRIEDVRVIALLKRGRTDGALRAGDAYRCDVWEHPLVELAWH